VYALDIKKYLKDFIMEILGIILLLTLFWSIRGLIGLFHRHNPIVIILYIIFLFPIAYCHMLILGIFGSSKKAVIKRKVEEEVEYSELLEKEKKKKKKKIK
tara:strand:- start:468 stop:770 length:303 start_codon:yes stop_codon:yes gene_type:complete